jgi:formyltetrahydrofolate synthetase
VVLVASIRALKVHSGMFKTAAGKPLDHLLAKEDADAVEIGCSNLAKQIGNARLYGIPCVVAINRFQTDTAKEISVVHRSALEHGAFDCVTSDIYRRGSSGGRDLARAVMVAAQGKPRLKFLYEPEMSIKAKIETIAKKVYGARGVRFEKTAEDNIAAYNKLGYSRLPVCMAKTHLSLSHDPLLKGAPCDFDLPVRDIRPAVGAGFLCALCGKIQTMPSLPSHPAGERIDIDSRGNLIYVRR